MPGKASELTLSKWLSLPLSAWNDIATIRQHRPNWSDAVAIKAAVAKYAAILEEEEKKQALEEFSEVMKKEAGQ